MHRLVQEVTRERQTGEERSTSLRSILTVLDQAAVGDPQDVRSWLVLDPLRPHLSAVTIYADRQGIVEPTSRLMNQLGLLLLAKASHKEAEPLMKRAVVIFLKSTRSTGHAHPHLKTAFGNYATLLEAMALSNEQIAQKFLGLGDEAGFDQAAYRQLLSEMFQ